MSIDEHHAVVIAAGCSRRLAHLTRTVPKSFLEVSGRRIMEHNLATLDAAGLRDVTMVVGYLKDVVRGAIGPRFGNLKINYVSSDDYATTGHGWSLYQARSIWESMRRPVVLVHADVVYHPEILRVVLDAPGENVLGADNHYVVRTNDEVVICGRDGRATGVRGISTNPGNVVGEVVGINRWSPDFLDAFFAFMESHFAAHGPNFNWEPLLDAFLAQHESTRMSYALTNGLPWVNVNYEEDLRLAETVHSWRRCA